MDHADHFVSIRGMVLVRWDSALKRRTTGKNRHGLKLHHPNSPSCQSDLEDRMDRMEAMMECHLVPKMETALPLRGFKEILF